MTKYTTISGDMWDLIAFKNYGTEKVFPKLIEANPQYCEIVIFPAGIILTLPEIDTTELADLPPWSTEL